MEENIKANMSKIKNKAMVYSFGLMGENMKESDFKENNREREHRFIPMEKRKLLCGKRVKRLRPLKNELCYYKITRNSVLFNNCIISFKFYFLFSNFFNYNEI